MNFNENMKEKVDNFQRSLESALATPNNWKCLIKNPQDLLEVNILGLIYKKENALQIAVDVYKLCTIEDINDRLTKNSEFYKKVSEYLIKKEDYISDLIDEISESIADPIYGVKDKLFEEIIGSSEKKEIDKKNLANLLRKYLLEFSDSNILDYIQKDLKKLGIESELVAGTGLAVYAKSAEECDSIDKKLEKSGVSIFFDNNIKLVNTLYEFFCGS